MKTRSRRRRKRSKKGRRERKEKRKKEKNEERKKIDLIHTWQKDKTTSASRLSVGARSAVVVS